MQHIDPSPRVAVTTGGLRVHGEITRGPEIVGPPRSVCRVVQFKVEICRAAARQQATSCPQGREAHGHVASDFEERPKSGEEC